MGEEEGMEVDGGEEIELIRSFESLAPISDAVLLGNEKGGGTVCFSLSLYRASVV